MSKILQIAQAIQTVLTTTVNKSAQKTGFTKHQSKLTGSAFVQTLVLGWLSDPQASLDNLASMAAQFGASISAQGLDQRFTAHSAACLSGFRRRRLSGDWHRSGRLYRTF